MALFLVLSKDADFKRTNISPKPKPVVEPPHISFKDVLPGEIQRASFIIRNIGGPYNKIWFSNPDSWIKVVSWSPLNSQQDDELPLRVKIEVEGKDWEKSYFEYIKVKLDEEETQLNIRTINSNYCNPFPSLLLHLRYNFSYNIVYNSINLV